MVEIIYKIIIKETTQSDEFPLLPSLNIWTQLHWGVPKWMEASNYLEKFLNLTLSLINPGLFKQGLDMLHKLRQLDTIKEIAQQWQSIYTGISIICNHRTVMAPVGPGLCFQSVIWDWI